MQIIVGKPNKCCNRTCKAKFFKDSFRGYMPKTPTEVYTIMQCPACKDQFAILQFVSMAKDYISELPQRPKTNKLNVKEITIDEVASIKKTLDGDENILTSLNEERFNKG